MNKMNENMDRNTRNQPTFPEDQTNESDYYETWYNSDHGGNFSVYNESAQYYYPTVNVAPSVSTSCPTMPPPPLPMVNIPNDPSAKESSTKHRRSRFCPWMTCAIVSIIAATVVAVAITVITVKGMGETIATGEKRREVVTASPTSTSTTSSTTPAAMSTQYRNITVEKTSSTSTTSPTASAVMSTRYRSITVEKTPSTFWSIRTEEGFQSFVAKWPGAMGNAAWWHDGVIYNWGGQNGELFLPTEYFWIFDPRLRTYSRIRANGDIPSAREGSVTVVLNGKFYVMGGFHDTLLNDTFVYDPSNNEWSRKTPMPLRGLSDSCGWEDGTNVFVFNVVTQGILRYQVKDDTWAETPSRGDKSNLKFHVDCVKRNNLVYAYGGINLGVERGTDDGMHVLDLNTWEWESIEASEGRFAPAWGACMTFVRSDRLLIVRDRHYDVFDVNATTFLERVEYSSASVRGQRCVTADDDDDADDDAVYVLGGMNNNYVYKFYYA